MSWTTESEEKKRWNETLKQYRFVKENPAWRDNLPPGLREYAGRVVVFVEGLRSSEASRLEAIPFDQLLSTSETLIDRCQRFGFDSRKLVCASIKIHIEQTREKFRRQIQDLDLVPGPILEALNAYHEASAVLFTSLTAMNNYATISAFCDREITRLERGGRDGTTCRRALVAEEVRDEDMEEKLLDLEIRRQEARREFENTTEPVNHWEVLLCLGVAPELLGLY